MSSNNIMNCCTLISIALEKHYLLNSAIKITSSPPTIAYISFVRNQWVIVISLFWLKSLSSCHAIHHPTHNINITPLSHDPIPHGSRIQKMSISLSINLKLVIFFYPTLSNNDITIRFFTNKMTHQDITFRATNSAWKNPYVYSYIIFLIPN